MLNLLSLNDAAFIVHYWATGKDWQLAFDPEMRKQVHSEQKEQNKYFMHQAYIRNAIDSGELPAMQKPKGKSADKKLFEKLAIPSEMYDAFPQFDYWITQEDLFVFIGRPSVISKDYAHGRDALARLLCALIDNGALNDKDLFNHLADKIVDAEVAINPNFKLGDNTLKGCCKEILDTLSAIKNNNSVNN